ncbi:MAG: glycosyltransferase family 1 protein, partial [Nanoarchaeota archaeon]
MKVTVSVGGRFHIFNLAQQLFKRGYLQRFITSYPKFEVVKYGIPRKFIKSILIKEIIQRSWDKLPKFARDFIDPVPFITDIYDFFASFFVGKPDIFVGNCLFSLRCIRAAKKVGALTVLEYGSSHFLYRDQVLNNECDKYGVKKEKNNSKISERIINEFKEADYISIPSNFVKRTFIENGVLESKLIQVPYGVDLSSFKQIPKDDSVFRVIFAGGMILRKGVHYLLQAFSELNLSNSELMLIGAINEEMEP